jgi:hypothetical protein
MRPDTLPRTCGSESDGMVGGEEGRTFELCFALPRLESMRRRAQVSGGKEPWAFMLFPWVRGSLELVVLPT